MRNKRNRLQAAVSGITFCFLGLGVANFTQAAIPSTEYDAVIHAARDGQTASAIEKLQAWHREYPENQKVLYDLVVVLAWAGDFNNALTYADELTVVGTPLYVLKSLGQSARSAERWSLAEKIYRFALRNDPNDMELRTGLVHALLGQKQSDLALQYVQSFLPTFSSAYKRSDAPMVTLLGFVYSRREEALYAANGYQDAVRLDPQSREAYRGYVFALNGAGMPYLAARSADKHLDWFSKEEQLQLAHSVAGHTVNFGETQLTVDERKPRFQTTDTALAETANVLNRFGPQAATRFDRMVALRDRQMMKEVVQLYQELLAAGVAMPSYAKAAAADAYLYLEQPEQARDLYISAINDAGRGDVANIDTWRNGLAYAYSEAEQHDEAQALADGVMQVTPTLANRGIPSVEAPNGDYPTATVTPALIRMYADRLKEAEKHLAELRAIAPFNGQTRLAWASLQSSREHPRTALDEFTLMQLDDHKSLGAQVGRGESLLALNEFAEAKAVLPPLQADYPEDKGVQNLARKLDIHDRPFLRVSTTIGKGGQLAGAESIFDAQLYSEPLTNSLGEAFRVFTHLSRSTGSVDRRLPTETSVPRTRIGVGLDYRVRDLEIEGEVNQATQNADKSGIALQVVKYFSDHWRMRLAADSNVNDLSAAAYNANVTGRRLLAGLTWQQNESRSIDTEVSTTKFSDGNQRDVFGIAWTERWMSGPIFKLDSMVSLATSRNSARDAVYFNPISDREATVALLGEWRTWRRYRRSMVQQVQVYTGRYWQEAFNTGSTSGLQYGHLWSFDDVFSIGYGLGVSMHPYDGVREKRHYGYLNLNWAIK
ncbi:haemin storage system, HmsH protein [Janthinobacterium sp. Marseille]|nr:poly-beta-1,6 N-acetyl-D-glucosamine export porin PgaA [Janthinobacterium sp. Marseille]ABR90681.1 haemin storage system, HmsH protein [Janthinobacterium sp. Marseille]